MTSNITNVVAARRGQEEQGQGGVQVGARRRVEPTAGIHVSQIADRVMCRVLSLQQKVLGGQTRTSSIYESAFPKRVT